jgi:hypothetical protein
VQVGILDMREFGSDASIQEAPQIELVISNTGTRSIKNVTPAYAYADGAPLPTAAWTAGAGGGPNPPAGPGDTASVVNLLNAGVTKSNSGPVPMPSASGGVLSLSGLSLGPLASAPESGLGSYPEPSPTDSAAQSGATDAGAAPSSTSGGFFHSPLLDPLGLAIFSLVLCLSAL